MKITKFEYKDHTTGWMLEPIEFNQLTLLVGASGVGKTRILKALMNLKKITQGASFNGTEWNICVSIDGICYEWSGAFENKGFFSDSTLFYDNDDDNEREKYNIEYEKVVINGNIVVDRTKDEICFEGNKTPKLSSKESIIELLKEEDQIQIIYHGFSQILFNDISVEKSMIRLIGRRSNLKDNKYADLDNMRNSSESLSTKFYLAYTHFPDEFEKIKEVFIDIFPYVEDIKIEPLKEFSEKLEPVVREIPILQIKETGVQTWIHEFLLSSGMSRSLQYIAELYLCADNTVILIDEFENSLGINCIDAITDSIVAQQRDLQFILTSHHPYIINNISPENWKIIMRKGSVVKNYTAEQLDIGKSKHAAFTQLINLDEYADGIEI